MYIYTIKDNDEPATGDFLAFLEANQQKFLKNTLNLEYKPVKPITPIHLQYGERYVFSWFCGVLS